MIIYSAFLLYTIDQSIKISERLIANAHPYEQHPPNPDKFILVAGDSTAVGVGAINAQESIAGRLGKQFPKADITNLAISGATLKDLLLILQKQERKHYDLIVIQIGANDITHLTDYHTIRVEISKVLFLCNKMSPKTLLLTAGNIGEAPVFYWPLSTFITARTLKTRHLFIEESLKYKTVVYIDLFKNPKDDPFKKDLKRYYAPDFFHLTSEGYEIWYKQIQKQLIL